MIEDDKLPVDITPPKWRSLDEELVYFDDQHVTVAERREKLYKMLDEATSEIKLSVNGDPEKLASQTELINMTSRLLKDMENAATGRANMKLKIKAQEDTSNLNAGISEILGSISMKGQNGLQGICLTPGEADQLVAQAFADKGCVAIVDQELSTDPTEVFEMAAVFKQMEEDDQKS